MNTSIYPWQWEDWHRLQTMHTHWPHVLLLHGPSGIGKADFARHLAAAQICEMPLEDGQPCHRCVACHWFAQGHHPDVRWVCPEQHQTDLMQGTRVSSTHPAVEKKRNQSSEIKIEQVRALIDFCALNTHRNGLRMIVLTPAEALNTAAANALLKTLEAPPGRTSFLLVCARLDRLPATIISRCQRWPMRVPKWPEALRWLNGQGICEAESALAATGGAPLAARAFAQDEYASARRFMLDQLAVGAQCDAFACSQTLQKVPVPRVLGWLQRWSYDLWVQCLTHQTRYYPGYAQALQRCAARLNALHIARFIRRINTERAVEHHPLNARLTFEVVLTEYCALFQRDAVLSPKSTQRAEPS